MPADTSFAIPPTGTLTASPESEAASRTVSPGANIALGFQRFTLAAGAAPYVVKVTLDRGENLPADGAFFRLRLEFEASTNPTVEVYDESEAGTLLQTVVGVVDSATVFLFEGIYENAVWSKYDGRYVP